MVTLVTGALVDLPKTPSRDTCRLGLTFLPLRLKLKFHFGSTDGLILQPSQGRLFLTVPVAVETANLCHPGPHLRLCRHRHCDPLRGWQMDFKANTAGQRKMPQRAIASDNNSKCAPILLPLSKIVPGPRHGTEVLHHPLAKTGTTKAVPTHQELFPKENCNIGEKTSQNSSALPVGAFYSAIAASYRIAHAHPLPCHLINPCFIQMPRSCIMGTFCRSRRRRF